MIDKDIIFGKINNIQNCLQRIHDTMNKKAFVWDYDAQDILVLNLQRAVQATTNIAAHIVSSENYGLVNSIKDLFDCLEKNHILSHPITEKMKKMVGFRNIAVHDYQEINPDILQAVISKHLGDFEEFYTAILSHYQLP